MEEVIVVVKMLDEACVEVKRSVELLCTFGDSSMDEDEDELTALCTTVDELTPTDVGGAGTLVDVEELCGSGRNTDVDETRPSDVLGACLLADAVDLAGGTARVPEGRRAIDLVVEASFKFSAPKLPLFSSEPSLLTSFRSKKCPMTLGDGFKALFLRANPGSVKLETVLEVSSAKAQQRATTR